MRHRLVVLLLLATLAYPAAASAGWFVGLGIGQVRGNLEPSKTVFTGQIGTVDPDKWVGFEFDYGYFNRESDIGVRTFGVSLLIGHKVFGNFRAYGSVGGGLIGGVGTFKDIFKIGGTTTQDPIATFGGGLMGDLTKRFGARFDVQRQLDLKKNGSGAESPTKYKLTRVTANVYLRF